MKLDKLVAITVAALEDIKASDIVILDVSKITPLFDYMIIASAESTRQTKALANNVRKQVTKAGGKVYSMEGEQSGEWVLVDLGDVVVHVMQPVVRNYYDLESLWAEAQAVKVKIAAASAGKAAAKPRKTPVKPALAASKVKSARTTKSTRTTKTTKSTKAKLASPTSRTRKTKSTNTTS